MLISVPLCYLSKIKSNQTKVNIYSNLNPTFHLIIRTKYQNNHILIVICMLPLLERVLGLNPARPSLRDNRVYCTHKLMNIEVKTV